ncbi:MAG: 4-alpha-glucanotransferase [Bacteroidales bacterium]|nr:4-alpha-glucanotransferase [Bacteroidales bacterium]
MSDVLKQDCPLVLKGETKKTGRGAGILLHITSLPGKYGVGSLGSEAYQFIDFLKDSHQTYWQILPFNPVSGTWSPYSSSSAFAGNTTWIDPEDLFRKKLIASLPQTLKTGNTVHFEPAISLRKQMLEEAFQNFRKKPNPLIESRFESFCQDEHYWLEDYALFCILKETNAHKAWDEWPEDFKIRERIILNRFRKKHAELIFKVKFEQYIFHEQFLKMKSYANSRGIRIIGDMPIYISYDSADVWANPQLFNLDETMRMKTMAGVPPDYFSNTGQLWGMPVFDWKTMKREDYSWWIERIRRNLKFCDILRFDHFRGFSSYWEVPSSEKTAVNGWWTSGPGDDFFKALYREFPSMPFIAEDLGEIDEDVYRLRDTFNLPGMRVIQFAFGSDLRHSVHAPHMHSLNSIIYTVLTTTIPLLDGIKMKLTKR